MSSDDALRPLVPEDILLWRSAGYLALSPDGTRLAFVESWCEADANENRAAIWVLAVDGSAPPRRITFGPRRDWSPKWSPDGRLLAFLSIRETDWRADLYLLNVAEGGDATPAARLPRGIDEFAWNGDGTRFALTGRPVYPDDRHRPTDDDDERRKRYLERVVYIERMHYRADGARLVDDEQPWVWVAGVDGIQPRAVVESTYPVQSPGWTPDGRVCFLSSREPDHELTWNIQVWAVAPDGGEPERLSQSAGAVQSYCFADGGALVYTAYPVPGLPVGCYDDQLWVDGKVVSDDLGVNVGKHVLADTVDPVSRNPTPTAVGEDVYVQASGAGAVHVYRYRDDVFERVLAGNRVVGEFAVGGEMLVFTSTAPDDPATIRVCRTDGSGERVLHEPNPWMRERSARECREFLVTVNGIRSQGWVMLPAEDDVQGPPAAVLNLHGGPHGAYGWAFNMLLRIQSSPEWAVIFGNPPGSLTYGEEFTRLSHKAWGEAEFPVLMAFCDEAVARGWADPDRLGVAGGSYGGFLACWMVGHTDRFKAAVAQRPPTNLTSIHGSSEFGWALAHGCFDAHPWEDPDLFRRLSPLTYAEGITTPLRLIGCTEDYRVPMEQVEQMYITLKTLGRPVDLVVFRESHMLVYHGKPWSRVAHADAIVDWFRRHLETGV